jgi:hypothetical protein
MPILGILASGRQPALNASSYASIATTTVGSGGAASVSFTSIPSTYTHLQIRAIARTDRATVVSGDWMKITFNGDSGSNYAFHQLRGDGASATAAASSSIGFMEVERAAGAASTASGFGAIVFDLLDYANTSKYKTQRTLGGYDNNGAGVVGLYSGVWMNTNAVTSITLISGGGSNFVQYSSFALYGIRGA